MAKQLKNYTENQTKFLQALAGEAKGNIKHAILLAGYAEGTAPNDIVKALKEEILEITMNILAVNAPKAAFGLIDLLDDPNAAGATLKLKVIQDLLTRVGAATKVEDVNFKVPEGGLFIMPAKGAQVSLEPPSIETEYKDITP